MRSAVEKQMGRQFEVQNSLGERSDVGAGRLRRHFVIRGGGSDIVGRGGEIDEESERVAKSGDFVEPSISEWGCGDWIDRETMERSVFGCHVRGVFAETFAVV